MGGRQECLRILLALASEERSTALDDAAAAIDLYLASLDSIARPGALRSLRIDFFADAPDNETARAMELAIADRIRSLDHGA